MSVPVTQLPPLHALDLPDPGPPRPAALHDGTPVWLVTRYHDARQVLTDPRFRRTPAAAPGGASDGHDGGALPPAPVAGTGRAAR
ncbi:hypothetical protein [Kitasatospora cheerisanensis]